MSNAEIICADKRMIEFADAQKKKKNSVVTVLMVYCIFAV